MSNSNINKIKASKILVPVDGSIPSFNAAKYAISFATISDARILLLSVVSSQIKHGDSSGFFGMVTPSYHEHYKKEAQKWFTQIIEDAKNQGYDINKISIDVITTPLSIVGAIVNYA